MAARLLSAAALSAAVPASAMRSTARLVTTTTDSAHTAEKIIKAAEELTGRAHLEEILSFFWWDGGVQRERERRISFPLDESRASLERVIASIAVVHNYDTPMIIAESAETGLYWKGTVSGGDAETAVKLTEARLVACAQLTMADGDACTTMTVKTVTGAKPLVEALLRGAHEVAWVPIEGNAPYLDWIRAETEAGMPNAASG